MTVTESKGLKKGSSAVGPMFESLSQCTVIIGNSKGGTSALAENLRSWFLQSHA
jgi:hypothetical protein